MDSKRALEELNIEELRRIVTEGLGYPRYRADQVFEWLQKGTDINGMNNVPKDLKDKLGQMFESSCPTVVKKLESSDGTVKYLFALSDGNTIECVVMRYRYGDSICLSTQVGCNMGCAFCASTIGGKVRNLTSSEIMGQILAAQKDLGIRISNIVLMGNGEPLDNYDNVLGFIRNAHDNKNIAIGYRHISLSTCGLCSRIHDLAEEGIPINLCISLHAPNDEVRNRLMPVNKRYSMSEVREAALYYIEKTNRRVTFEYALIDGVNSSLYMARELAGYCKNMLCHVNLIPINYVKEHDFRPPTEDKIRAFAGELKKYNIPVTIRRKLGSDISASCGQLRKGKQGDDTNNV